MHYFKTDKSLVVPPCSTPGGDKRHASRWAFGRKFNSIQFLFKTFVNTVGTFGSKSPENKGLISTREKNPYTGKNLYKNVHSAERSFRNTDFWKKIWQHCGSSKWASTEPQPVLHYLGLASWAKPTQASSVRLGLGSHSGSQLDDKYEHKLLYGKWSSEHFVHELVFSKKVIFSKKNEMKTRF